MKGIFTCRTRVHLCTGSISHFPMVFVFDQKTKSIRHISQFR